MTLPKQDLTKVDPEILRGLMENLMERLPTVRFVQTNWIINIDKDKKDLPDGAQVAIDMSRATQAWLKFSKNAIVERHSLGLFADEKLPSRDELGDTDETEWELGNDGKPQDPWAKAYEIPGVLLSKKGNVAVNLTGSGYNYGLTIGNLIRAFFADFQANASKVPLLDLKQKRKTDKHGKKMVPVLVINSWVEPPEVEEKPAEMVDAEQEETDF
ncbi:MAG: hypothetical protein ACR2QF_05395 [Geminicoccaceae bacterium]